MFKNTFAPKNIPRLKDPPLRGCVLGKDIFFGVWNFSGFNSGLFHLWGRIQRWLAQSLGVTSFLVAAFGASCRFRLCLSCLGLLLVPHLLSVILGHLAVGVVPLLADQTLVDLLGAVGLCRSSLQRLWAAVVLFRFLCCFAFSGRSRRLLYPLIWQGRYNRVKQPPRSKFFMPQVVFHPGVQGPDLPREPSEFLVKRPVKAPHPGVLPKILE